MGHSVGDPQTAIEQEQYGIGALLSSLSVSHRHSNVKEWVNDKTQLGEGHRHTHTLMERGEKQRVSFPGGRALI